MKVVIDARESGTSTGRYIDKVIEHMQLLKPGFDITVLTKPARVEFIRHIAPEFEVVETKYKEGSFGEQLGFRRQLKRLDADLVHFGMPQQPVLYSGRAVTTIHDLTTTRFDNPTKNWLVYNIKQAVYRRVIKHGAKHSAQILCPSQFTKDDLVKFARIDPAKVAVTYEAADKISAPSESVDSVKPEEFIMYVGRPLPHKNLRRLIDAFAQLQADRPKLQLVLAGKSDKLYNRFARQVKRRKLANVIFTDFVSEGQLRWLYENCAAYVFPSLSEGFGLPGLEAMVHGAPVISSNATCLPEIYGSAAHYFDPLDTDDMAAKIAEVLDDKTLRQKLIKAGHAQAAKYSWAKTAAQTLEVYKKALKA